MPAYKDETRGSWYVSFRYVDWTGKRIKKLKRGFQTRKEALAWERSFLMQKKADLNMKFEDFIKIYYKEKKIRLKQNTWETKVAIIEKKLLPYFGNLKLNEIEPKDVVAWQNEMMAGKTKNGTNYSATYLKTLHNQLSAIFNHAVKYYNLRSNPAAKAGSMGKKESGEMLFWTKEEYLKFADSMMDKPLSFYAFEILYWCGIRSGELLALTADDFDFKKNTVSITKSYQRIKGKDVITEPKTPKSIRIITMPEFLVEEIQEYLSLLYKYNPNDRLFPITKSYLHHEMGFSALAIADRLGHESIDITFRYAHLFPTKQREMAEKLNMERI